MAQGDKLARVWLNLGYTQQEDHGDLPAAKQSFVAALSLRERLRQTTQLRPPEIRSYAKSYADAAPVLLGEQEDPAGWLRPVLNHLMDQLDLAPILVDEAGPDWALVFHFTRDIQKTALTYALRHELFDWALELLNQMHGRVLVQEALDAVEGALYEPALATFSESRATLRAIREQLIHTLGQLNPMLIEEPTNGRRATIEFLSENVDALRAEERAAIDAMAIARAGAAQVPGFEALDPGFVGVTLSQLQQAVPADGATVLLIDVPDVTSISVGGMEINIGRTEERVETVDSCLAMVVRRDKVQSLELPDLPVCIESMTAYVASRNADVDARRASSTARDSTSGITDGAGFQHAVERLDDAFWSPLQALVGDVTEICLITHGQSHILPFSAGQPEGVALKRYPGLTIYGQHQGWIESPAEAQTDETPLPMGMMMNARRLPWVEHEAMVIPAVWDGAEAVDGWDGRAMERGHIACHGDTRGAIHDGAYNEGVLLVGGEAQVLGAQETVLSPHRLPAELLVMACLVGQVSDDRLGTPTGLVVSMMRRGAQVVVGALTPINDVASGWLSVMIHEVWHAEKPLVQAVEEAKAALCEPDDPLWDRAEARLRPLVRAAVADSLDRENANRRNFGKQLLTLEEAVEQRLQRPARGAHRGHQTCARRVWRLIGMVSEVGT